ncbi:MAG: hydrolase [Actinomycetia bacterium]|jgi:2-keto-4-pentenoate hydratase/2-oxohepta-3-ene-1,7-dioic acid hydratase in catechol pathway|nr:hydrolase [Actinomycetes bacterium]
MRLVTFSADSASPRTGALVAGGVVDLADAGLPADMTELIRLGDPALASAAEAIERAAPVADHDVRIHAPIPRPRKNVMCVGRNYADHAAEFSRSGFDASERSAVPEHPVIFTKAASSVIGPDEPILVANDPTGTTDYEGELGVVIGRSGRRIQESDADAHVFGYTIVNDVTARDLQHRHVQWFLGKSPDTFCPMGPAIVTADELPDVGASWLRTHVNGELRQEAPISSLIFDIPSLIRTISETMLLEPGDVIATGTPAGAGIGLEPPRFLVPGDRVEVSVDGIGTLGNPVR